jgi:hypothetical protein
MRWRRVVESLGAAQVGQIAGTMKNSSYGTYLLQLLTEKVF